MDIPRETKGKNRRRWLYGAAAVAVVALITFGVSRLEPAAPTVDRATIWTDTVRRGTMVREVRGPGTLEPEHMRFITATSGGRIERIHVQPGDVVEQGDVLLELSNPDVRIQLLEAQRQLAGAKARLATLRATLENQRLNQKAAVATALSEYRQAKRQYEADKELAEKGLIAEMKLATSRDILMELETRLAIERKRLEFLSESMDAQLAAQRAEVARLQSLLEFKRRQVESLEVRATTSGVVQGLSLEIGQWVQPGTTLARIARPGQLMAVLRIPQTQAPEVAVGQPVEVDTRNAIIEGRVSHIDPAVQNGTVEVEVELEGPLPDGARPDLSVDGTITVDRLEDVLYVGRPAYGRAHSTITMFELAENGEAAERVRVRLGTSSVNTIQVLEGLEAGDVVILSDMSQWDGAERVELE